MVQTDVTDAAVADGLFAYVAAAVRPSADADDTLGDERLDLAARLDLIARIEAPKEVRERGYGIAVGTVIEVREEHNRGVIVTRPDEPSEYGDDVYRTVWLNEGGAELVEQARALMGKRVRVWKYPEAHASKPGTTVRMLAKIEAAGPARTPVREPQPVAAASSNGRHHVADDGYYDEPF